MAPDATLTSPYAVEQGPLAAGPSQIGRYRISEVLGVGAMGVVYRAHDPDLDRDVAIKLVRDSGGSPKNHARLLREAQAMARLRHPNVVPIFDVGQFEGTVFVAMALLDGGTLKRWLCDGHRSFDAIVDRFLAAGRGLAAAHAAGLVHRDFKPDNVLLGIDGEIQVADFGLARLADDEPVASAPSHALAPGMLTQTGEVLGTLPYMAPEQLRNEPLDARADQFSFCVALWEAVYGSRPFPDPRMDVDRPLRARLETIAAGPMPRPRDRPAWIAPPLARGLAVDPDERWPTMQELLDAIARRRGSRLQSRWLAAGLGIVILAVAILAFGSLTGREARHRDAAVQGRGRPSNTASRGSLSVASVASDTCPVRMVHVPRGKAVIGSPDSVGDADEHPLHEVELAAFCIDRTEVTVGAYEDCVASAHCTPPAVTVYSSDYLASDIKRLSQFCNGNDRPDHPLNCVDWYQATAYCAWADKRLPTEAEWEYAARGPDGRAYPWGNEPPTSARLNSNGDADGFKTTAPVGSFPDGASPFGALDMAGNVWEWTADVYAPYPHARVTTLRGATGTTRSLRGGGWMNLDTGVARAAFRNWGDPRDRINTLGFRCARDD